MIDVNIVSTDRRLSRLLELEAMRMGLSASVNGENECRVCLVDADTVPPFSTESAVILFGGREDSIAAYHAGLRLEKPFLLTELRRILSEQLSPQAPVPIKPRRRKLHPHCENTAKLTVDHDKKTASVGTEEPIKLSDTEYRLLCRLQEFGKTPLSEADVTDILGSSNSNKFNVYVCFLRRKLERGGLRVIRTVRGKGYILNIQ